MKNFYLERTEDVSGVSGTGRVAEGVLFSNGKAVIAWSVIANSLGIYDSIEEIEKIHGHNGATKVVFVK